MQIRAFVDRHPWTRALFVVALVLFVVVCALHVTGGHHSVDGDGSAFADSSAGLALVVVMVVGLLALLVRRRPLPSRASRPRCGARAAPHLLASGHTTLEAPLRC